MSGGADLVGHLPWVHRTPTVVRVRRAVGAAVVAAAVAAVPLSGVVPPSAVASHRGGGVPSRSDVLRTASPGPVPSEVVASLTGTGWRLMELSLRPWDGTSALLSARLAAPEGRPAQVERLLASFDDPQLRRATVEAIVATTSGTAVTVSARLDLDDGPVPGEVVADANLPGAIARVVTQAGGRLDGVRVVPPAEPDAVTAVVVAFVAAPERTTAVLRALEHGPSAPQRMRNVLVRAADAGLLVEVVLTPREVPEWSS